MFEIRACMQEVEPARTSLPPKDGLREEGGKVEKKSAKADRREWCVEKLLCRITKVAANKKCQDRCPRKQDRRADSKRGISRD